MVWVQVKKKREEKERELEAMEEEKRMAQQEKEDELFRGWMAKEEGFHMDQVGRHEYRSKRLICHVGTSHSSVHSLTIWVTDFESKLSTGKN